MRVILGLYGDNGKEPGNYYNGLYRVEGFMSSHNLYVCHRLVAELGVQDVVKQFERRL